MIKFLCLAVVLGVLSEVQGHGRLLEPPNRSSLWRTDRTAPTNYNDNELFCGGRQVQWEKFDGKCGVCGDRYDAPHPQPNENTGFYGQGKVVRTYKPGSIIDINVNLTANHKGNFQYSICKLVDPTKPESGEDCFVPITLGDGRKQYDVHAGEKDINHTVKLPDDLTCDRCVLRWQYTAGNTWGDCGNGTFANGCGPQETFRNCADVSILS